MVAILGGLSWSGRQDTDDDRPERKLNKMMDLAKRRKRLKRKQAIRKAIGSVLTFILVISIMAVGINAFLNAWDKEMDSQAEYNRQYIQEMNMERMKNGFDPIQ